MNQIQTEQFKNKLDNLGKFTVNKKEFTSEEIINWLAECVTTFSEIGVSQIIIDDFLKFFSLKREKTKYKKSFYKDGIITIQSFGPFKEKIEKIGPDYSLGSENMITAFVLTNQYEVSNNFYYAKIAFSAAKNILKQTTDGEKLVPHWLQNTFKESEEYSHLNSSLKLIEENYRDKNTSGLITNAITLLDTILNIDSELNKKGRLGGKLNSLIENEKKRKTFGVSTDLVKALNNGRIIRNEGIIHKDVPIKYNIPFMIATSFAYLVIFFTEVAILNGNIFKLIEVIEIKGADKIKDSRIVINENFKKLTRRIDKLEKERKTLKI